MIILPVFASNVASSICILYLDTSKLQLTIFVSCAVLHCIGFPVKKYCLLQGENLTPIPSHLYQEIPKETKCTA